MTPTTRCAGRKFTTSAGHKNYSQRSCILRWLTVAIIAFAGVEISSFVFLYWQRTHYGQLFHFDIDRYVAGLHPERLRQHQRAAEMKSIYAPHPTLGWQRTPLSTHFFEEFRSTTNTNSIGARIIPDAVGPVSIATYGDSFTEGLEVDDAETWQAYIAYATGTQVLNFGVSGYGPDQSLLALEANLNAGIHSPFVILAVIHDDLHRMMNTFRLFYTYPIEDMFLGFKPIFIPTESGFATLSFAPEDITDADDLRRALWAASEYDWFYQRRTEQFRFPFSLNAARFVLRQGINPSIWPDYSVGLARARIEYIIDRFHRLSRKYEFTPVLVLLPETIGELRRRRGNEHVLTAVVDGSVRPGLIYIDVVKELSEPHVEMIARNFTPESFIKHTHPSPAGNRAIANVILSKLQDELNKVKTTQK